MLPSLPAWIAALVLALLFGSFLNVCISRLPRHRSIVRPASHCPRCLTPVRPRDNIPVLSWLLLRGRCRTCREPIALRYPLVEAGYATLVAASIARFGFSAEAFAASIFCFLALGLLVMDLETMLLPDAFTLPGLALGLAWALLAPAIDSLLGREHASHVSAAWLGVTRLGEAALAAVGWALLLLFIRWGYYALRRAHGLGLGDVKLVAMLAAWLGTSRTALCFLLAVIGAAMFGAALIALGRVNRAEEIGFGTGWGKMRVPLGAFLCGGGLYSLMFGVKTINWYLKLFV